MYINNAVYIYIKLIKLLFSLILNVLNLSNF